MDFSYHSETGEPGYDTWPPNAWKYIGGVNDWAGMSLDKKRGLVFLPLGSATYDFYGAERIGRGGIQKIVAYAVKMHPQRGKGKQVLSDATLQGNNVTFPTDGKLAGKVIDKCNRIAKVEKVDQRQTYVRVSKQLLRDSYNAKHPPRRKKVRKARPEHSGRAG